MKIFRNAPCICGSGKKYKKCCGLVDVVSGNKQENETEHFIKEEVPFSPDIPEFSEDFFNKLDTAKIDTDHYLGLC